MKMQQWGFLDTSSLLVLLTMIFCTDSYSSEVSYKAQNIATLGIGHKLGQVGGMTDKEKQRKEDPFAFADYQPQDLYVRNDNVVVIADTENNRLQLYDSKTGTFQKLDTPSRVASNSKGHLAVLGDSSSKLYIFRGSVCTSVNLFANQITGATEISLDDAFVYVRRSVGDTRKISLDGSVLGSETLTIDKDYLLVSTILKENGYEMYDLLSSEGSKFVALADKNKNRYLVGYENNEIKFVVNDKLGGYELYRWFVAQSGQIYALGRNGASRDKFLAVYKFVLEWSHQGVTPGQWTKVI